MRVLITGAGGFVGGHLARRLSAEHELIALSRREPAGSEADGIDWVTQDLTRPLDRGSLPARVDAVMHLAQSERYRELPEGAADVFEVNLGATFRLLEYARESSARHFVLASTGGLYEPGPGPLGEDAPVRPIDLYFRSKHLAEQLLEDYSSSFQVSALRLFFVYGPGPSRMLISGLAQRVAAGETITVEGPRGLRLNPLFVGDAARAFELALGAQRGGIFNVAGAEAVELVELIELIGELCGREAIVRHQGEDPGGLVGDTSRIERALGFAPEVSLREGLGRLLKSGAPAR